MKPHFQSNRIRTPEPTGRSRSPAAWVKWAAHFALLLCCLPGAHGLRISEFKASSDDRLLHYLESGQALVGSGPAWHSRAFDDSLWSRDPATSSSWSNNEYGFTGAIVDVSADMLGRTPALYLRMRFAIPGGQLPADGALHLEMSCTDGWIAYLNGVEVARRNMGPRHLFAYHDQRAFRREEATAPVVVDLGPPDTWLREGDNVLAVQVHNNDPDDDEFRVLPRLYTATGPLPTVGGSHGNAYFVGTIEPSGGIFDSSLGDPEFADWVEIHNDGETTVALGQYSLTDDDDEPAGGRSR